MINVIALINQQVLISTIEEVPSELGEPDCKLVDPYVVKTVGDNQVLEPFMMGLTEESSFMISSDKILTLVEPNSTLLKKYKDLLK
tara:strand:+ start:420 stop:677 length:258 start_codon:yes stop_codon:yes gene_type:complete